MKLWPVKNIFWSSLVPPMWPTCFKKNKNITSPKAKKNLKKSLVLKKGARVILPKSFGTLSMMIKLFNPSTTIPCRQMKKPNWIGRGKNWCNLENLLINKTSFLIKCQRIGQKSSKIKFWQYAGLKDLKNYRDPKNSTKNLKSLNRQTKNLFKIGYSCWIKDANLKSWKTIWPQTIKKWTRTQKIEKDKLFLIWKFQIWNVGVKLMTA